MFLSQMQDSAAPTHRYRLLFFALLGQVLNAVHKELVGADVGPACLDHPTAQLHQLEGAKIKIITLNTQQEPCLFKDNATQRY